MSWFCILRTCVERNAGLNVLDADLTWESPPQSVGLKTTRTWWNLSRRGRETARTKWFSKRGRTSMKFSKTHRWVPLDLPWKPSRWLSPCACVLWVLFLDGSLPNVILNTVYCTLTDEQYSPLQKYFPYLVVFDLGLYVSNLHRIAQNIESNINIAR